MLDAHLAFGEFLLGSLRTVHAAGSSLARLDDMAVRAGIRNLTSAVAGLVASVPEVPSKFFER